MTTSLRSPDGSRSAPSKPSGRQAALNDARPESEHAADLASMSLIDRMASLVDNSTRRPTISPRCQGKRSGHAVTDSSTTVHTETMDGGDFERLVKVLPSTRARRKMGSGPALNPGGSPPQFRQR